MKKSVISVLSVAAGAATGVIGVKHSMKKRIEQERKNSDRHLALFLMMNKWVNVKQEGKCLSSYFENRRYYKIAVYGMSYAGQTLVEELSSTNINIEYGIDQKAETVYADFEVVTPEDELADVDAVVVTAITFFPEIERLLSRKVSCPVISLEDILYEI